MEEGLDSLDLTIEKIKISLPLYSALKRDGHKVKLYNPIQTNGYRKINIRKTKTDPIDSAIIAEMLRHRLIEKQALCKLQFVRKS